MARRWWRPASALFALLLTLTAAVFPAATPAVAFEDFCAGDPIIQIGHEILRITVAIPRARLDTVTAQNPVRIVVVVPESEEVRVLATTGIVPERVDLVRVPRHAEHGAYRIGVGIRAPEPHGTPDYPVQFSLISRIDRVVGQGSSGDWIGRTVSVPDR